ncbi:hypothetical protein [Clostridium beijerinckii]|uniref:hypothetical protein n=1 Tax=Clostridium beijerinckii TaxID=1520 RepID=UPI00156F7C0F|nr:hypothetical protein [Clostridium beijerinckii]
MGDSKAIKLYPKCWPQRTSFELAHLEQLIAKESHPSKLPMKHSTKVYYSFLVGRYFIV